MKTRRIDLCFFGTLLAVVCAPAYATVAITSFTASPASPQLLGTPITWTAKATDSNPGPLTFQFNVQIPAQAFSVIKDYNVGTLSAGVWTGQPFVWVPTGVEGTYHIKVVIKDFTSGETTSDTATFVVKSRVTGSTPVITRTLNPIVVLFSAPSCAAGSSMRVEFQQQSKATPPVVTNYQTCHPPGSMNFEIAGMYPKTAYNMFSQTKTGGTVTNGPTVSITTGALPSNITFPTFTVNTPAGPNTDKTDSVLLQNLLQFGAVPIYPAVATDLAGRIIWYYNPGQSIFLTRPLTGGTMLTYQSGTSWNPLSTELQLFQQIDLAGNIIKETNIGVLSAQLLAMGATDAAMCNTITNPVVGSACIGSFHHDAIQTLPNGETAVLADIEKIYPTGTQNDTQGKPVDIVGDIVIVLDKNWQVLWYFDTFEHAGGAPQLDINRAAVLGETCKNNQGGCPPLFLLGTGIAPIAHDWLHMNSIYYWPTDSNPGAASGDLVVSMRNQDWVAKVDYNNGTGTGNVLWLMGPCGAFTFNNTYNDPWPWFSHQHEFGIENAGTNPATIFDNGNTRYSQPGKSTGCMQGVGTGNSRGMSLTLDDNPSSLQVTPVLSVDLGAQSSGDGSAQLLTPGTGKAGNGNYFFANTDVFQNLSFISLLIEIEPTAGTDTGTQVLNIQAPQNYRAWRMSSLYAPPTT